MNLGLAGLLARGQLGVGQARAHVGDARRRAAGLVQRGGKVRAGCRPARGERAELLGDGRRARRIGGASDFENDVGGRVNGHGFSDLFLCDQLRRQSLREPELDACNVQSISSARLFFSASARYWAAADFDRALGQTRAHAVILGVLGLRVVDVARRRHLDLDGAYATRRRGRRASERQQPGAERVDHLRMRVGELIPLLREIRQSPY